MRERDVEVPCAREAAERSQARRHCPNLARARRPGVRRPDDGVLEACVVEELERLCKVPRGDGHLVPPSLEQADERPEEDHVR